MAALLGDALFVVELACPGLVVNNFYCMHPEHATVHISKLYHTVVGRAYIRMLAIAVWHASCM